MRNNGMRLTQIAQADSIETKFMVSISNKMYEDSRTMRIATVIAMLYLPANLVMVCLPWLPKNSIDRPTNTLHSVFLQYYSRLVRQQWWHWPEQRRLRVASSKPDVDCHSDDYHTCYRHNLHIVVVGSKKKKSQKRSSMLGYLERRRNDIF